jgi:hypothetical protein
LKLSGKLQGSRAGWALGGLAVRVWMNDSSPGALVSSCAIMGVFLNVSDMPGM